MTSEDKTVQEKVDELQSPDTFDFMSVIGGDGRGYPKDEVTIFLDEATAYQIDRLTTKAAKLDSGPEFDALVAEIGGLRKKLGETAYTFKLSGVSQEFKDDLLVVAQKQFPILHDQNKNFLTGGLQKVERPSPERNEYFSILILQAHVEQIVAPDGRVDTAPGVETIRAFVKKAPESQVDKFVGAVEGLNVSSEAFEQATSEDFLAKS